jgi:hypothetical protein
VGAAAAAIAAAGYWVLWMREPLGGGPLVSAGGWHHVQTVLAARPGDAVLLCILPAVGMLAGLLIAVRFPRATGIVLCSLLGGFALTFAGLLLAGHPARLDTLALLAAPSWLWLIALALAGAGAFLQLHLCGAVKPAGGRTSAAEPHATASRRRRSAA